MATERGSSALSRRSCSSSKRGSDTKSRKTASCGPARLCAVPAEELDLVLERLPRHQLFAEIPAALRRWLLPIDWDRERLWALDLPHRRLDLDELRWHLGLPWWRREGVWFQVTPNDFLADPMTHPEHANRVANADLSYPLHVVPPSQVADPGRNPSAGQSRDAWPVRDRRRDAYPSGGRKDRAAAPR